MNLKKCIVSKYSIALILLVFIQQIIAASSSFFLVDLVTSIKNGQNLVTPAILYFSSLILPYIPAAFFSYLLEASEVKANHNLISKMTLIYQGAIAKWSDREKKESITAIATRDGQATLKDLIIDLYGVYSITLNVILQSLAVVLVTDVSLAYGFAIGFFLCATMSNMTKPINKKLAARVTNSRLGLTQNLSKFWDNILLNNKINRSIWTQKTETSFDNLNNEVKKYGLFLGSSSATYALFSALPVILAGSYAIFSKNTSTELALAVVVMFPRIFQIQACVYELISSWTKILGISGKIQRLEDLLAESSDPNIKRFVDDSKISIVSDKASITVEDLFNKLKSAQIKARYTIRGPNGCGKSSLLTLIKQEYPKSSILIPVKNDLEFSSKKNSQSSGQQTMAIFGDLFEEKELPNIVLLDEWDAYLDDSNTEVVNKVIDKIAEKSCVIEVRHRKEV